MSTLGICFLILAPAAANWWFGRQLNKEIDGLRTDIEALAAKADARPAALAAAKGNADQWRRRALAAEQIVHGRGLSSKDTAE